MTWQAKCLDCGWEAQASEHRGFAEGQAAVHKTQTGHDVLVHVRVDVKEGVTAVGKVI